MRGFLVLYPNKSASANNNTCWNWFEERKNIRLLKMRFFCSR
ncbi:PHB depolymerase family esterase [Cytobacillus sp. FSL W7-1323]